ncbi:MAG TPA: pyridoxamine 5'-phosphate oxidase [Devosia sp.]|nr:pyridoxamine 5'-phosphate oxidase [Devosia sp.]
MVKADKLTTSLFDDLCVQKPDPMELFAQWLEQARKSEVNDANAMVLATVDADGMPDCRIMLLNGFGPDGFVFYTNTLSAKGSQLAANPKAAILFHWKSSRRQVRVRGMAHKISDQLADAYFQSRPRGSRIGAHASFQSQPLANRDELETRVKELTEQFDGEEVPRPAHWTGYEILPLYIEFWQDGEFRLHDRFVYRRESSKDKWKAERLNP